MSYWTSPEGKEVGILVHDTNGPSSTIRYGVENIRHRLKELGVDDKQINKTLDHLDSARERHLKAVDRYYSFSKAQYEQQKANNRGQDR